MKLLMKMCCPNCFQEGKKYPLEFWTHGSDSFCGGNLYLDEKGYVYCEKCHKKAKASRMILFCNCGNHVQERIDKTGFVGAVSLAGIGVSQHSASWLKELIKNIK